MNRTIKYILFYCCLCLAELATGQGGKKENSHLFIIDLPTTNYSVTLVKWNKGVQQERMVAEKLDSGAFEFKLLESELPGQFLLEFIPETEGEKKFSMNVFMTDKDLHLELSDWNSKLNWHGDMENLANEVFMQKCVVKKQQLQVLQNFLANYTEGDELSKQALKTYQQNREEYNRWVNQQISENGDLWVSHYWKNQLITSAEISGNQEKNVHEFITHAFDYEDFTDTILLNTDYYQNLLNNYMSMNEMLVQFTGANRDSSMTLAGDHLAQKASTGNPRLYGWVVDYLFTNYERYAIDKGIAMLQEHLNNPNCLTFKRQEIENRLKGMQLLKPDITLPSLQLVNVEDDTLTFTNKGGDKLALLVFYHSTCEHCHDLLSKLKKWQQTNAKQEVTVLSISVDDDPGQWRNFHKEQNFNWLDLHASGGINSKAAHDYFVLSTPSMFLVGQNMVLELVPNSIVELFEFLYGEEESKAYISQIFYDK